MMKFVWIGLFALGGGNAFAAKNTIHWLTMDLPPINIEAGKFKRQGLVDVEYEIYRDVMKEYRHEFVNSNPRRMMELLLKETSQIYCAGSFLPLPGIESPRDVYLSEPVHAVLPNVLMMRSDVAKEIVGDKKKISLERVLEKGNYTLGFIPQRPYGGTVNEVLSKFQGSKALIAIPHSGQGAVLKMLETKRVDVILGYSMETTFYQKSGEVSAAFVEVDLEEEPASYNYFVACNKHPASKKLIQDVNQVLAQHRKDARFFRAFKFWYNQEDFNKFKRLNQMKDVY